MAEVYFLRLCVAARFKRNCNNNDNKTKDNNNNNNNNKDHNTEDKNSRVVNLLNY